MFQSYVKYTTLENLPAWVHQFLWIARKVGNPYAIFFVNGGDSL